MRTEDCKLEDAGCATVPAEVRKNSKPGMLGVDRVGDRRSWAILAQHFSGG
jgi:hypothetical protein